MSGGGENPWESAANDRLWNGNDNEPASFRRHNNNNNTTTTTARSNSVAAVSSSSSSTDWWKIPFLIDILCIFTIGGYTGYNFFTGHEKNKNSWYYTIAICILFISGLGLVRSILVVLGRRRQQQQGPPSLFLHRLLRTSHGLASSLFGMTTIILWSWLHWGKQENNNTLMEVLEDLVPWSQHKHPQVLPCILLGLTLWEGMRYVLLSCCCRSDEDEDDEDNEHNNNNNDGNSSRRSSPWWWTRNTRSQYNEPLLDETGNPHWSTSGSRPAYEMDEGIDATRSSFWWPFGGGRRSHDNPRDDGSVDYASLSEDWASRSQDDPFWWTKEGGGETTSRINNNGNETANPGWAAEGGGPGTSNENAV